MRSVVVPLLAKPCWRPAGTTTSWPAVSVTWASPIQTSAWPSNIQGASPAPPAAGHRARWRHFRFTPNSVDWDGQSLRREVPKTDIKDPSLASLISKRTDLLVEQVVCTKSH